MLTIGDKQYRNLQEQVLKNQEDIKYILEEEGVLNEFGIKVVGKVDNAGQLPNSDTYAGEYGDAFAVGTETPYDLYIWTRAFSGQANPFWFNIGKFPVPSTIPGPEGPAGKDGAAGQRGSLWQSNKGQPQVSGSNLRFDQALDASTGDVYQFNGSSWVLMGNIRGPQGIQGLRGQDGQTGPIGPVGPMGPQGPAGQFIRIVGELTSTDQLPTPTEAIRNDAYLIPIDGINHVYLISGTTDLVWVDAGSFGAGGGKISASGQNVSELDVTYVDTNANVEYVGAHAQEIEGQIYISAADQFSNAGGTQVSKTVTIPVPIEGTDNIDVSVENDNIQIDLSESVKESLSGNLKQVSTPGIVYATDGSGNQTMLKYNSGSTGNSLVQRQSNGNITVPTAPQTNSDAASKKYVDDTEDLLQAQIDTLDSIVPQKVDKAGDVMTGELTAPNFKLSEQPAQQSNPTQLAGFIDNDPTQGIAYVTTETLAKTLGVYTEAVSGSITFTARGSSSQKGYALLQLTEKSDTLPFTYRYNAPDSSGPASPIDLPTQVGGISINANAKLTALSYPSTIPTSNKRDYSESPYNYSALDVLNKAQVAFDYNLTGSGIIRFVGWPMRATLSVIEAVDVWVTGEDTKLDEEPAYIDFYVEDGTITKWETNYPYLNGGVSGSTYLAVSNISVAVRSSDTIADRLTKVEERVTSVEQVANQAKSDSETALQTISSVQTELSGVSSQVETNTSNITVLTAQMNGKTLSVVDTLPDAPDDNTIYFILEDE